MRSKVCFYKMFHQNLLQSGERILLLYNFTASTKHYISLEGWEQITTISAWRQSFALKQKLATQLTVGNRKFGYRICYQSGWTRIFSTSHRFLDIIVWMLLYIYIPCTFYFLNAMSNEPWIKQSCFHIDTLVEFSLSFCCKNCRQSLFRFQTVTKIYVNVIIMS